MSEHRPTGRQWEFLIYALVFAAVIGYDRREPQPTPEQIAEWAKIPIERDEYEGMTFVQSSGRYEAINPPCPNGYRCILSDMSDAGIVNADSVTSGNLSRWSATTSAQMSGVLTNETGTGAVVFPTEVTYTTAVCRDTGPTPAPATCTAANSVAR